MNRAPSFTSTPLTAVTRGQWLQLRDHDHGPRFEPGGSLRPRRNLPGCRSPTTETALPACRARRARVNNGANAVVLRVTDSGGLFTEQTFTITVRCSTAAAPEQQRGRWCGLAGRSTDPGNSGDCPPTQEACRRVNCDSLRARVETQLGYNNAKFLRRIVVTDEFDNYGELCLIQNGWSWYAGI